MIILVFVETTTVTTPTGWTLLKHIEETTAATSQTEVFYKEASGSEGASVTVTTSTSKESSHFAFRITDYNGNPEVSTGATGGISDPDPDSLTPSGGAKDYLWITYAGHRAAETVVSYPTNFTDNNNAIGNGGSFVAQLEIATRSTNASSQNPGIFDLQNGVRWTAGTIAVAPVAADTGNFFLVM